MYGKAFTWYSGGVHIEHVTVIGYQVILNLWALKVHFSKFL